MPLADIYVIKASEPVEVTGREENNISMALESSDSVNGGTVTGIVKDSTGTPVSNAAVKLCLPDLSTFKHSKTSSDGKYSFNNIPVGSYLITAKKDAYLLPPAISVSVNANRTTTVDITLEDDPFADKNVIFGIIQNSTGNAPIDSVFAHLYERVNGVEEYKGYSKTNDVGQYFFTQLDDGTYYIKASKEGFFTAESADLELSSKEYSKVDMSLTEDPDSNTGIICGVITDKDTGSIIADCDVALYEINGDEETLISIMHTNQAGQYLFGGIKSGKYRIKATLQIETSS